MDTVTVTDFSQLRFAGQIAHWVVAVLLLVFFIQLPRFGALRQLLPTWIAAWTALVVATTVPALGAIGALSGRFLVPDALAITFDFLGYPAEVLFVLFVTLAAVQASGRRIPAGIVQSVIMGGALVAMVVNVADQFALANRFLLLATPVLFVGTAQLLFATTRDHRASGMSFLAVVMVLFAAVSTLFKAAPTELFQRLAGDALGQRLVSSDDFGMAIMVALLGAATVVVVVQDSLHLAATAQEDRLREVGASEDRLKRILEAAGEAIVTFDGSSRVVLANAAAGRLFQLPAPALVGRELGRLVLAAGSPEMITWTTAVDPGAHPGTGMRPNGTTFPAELTIGPLAGEDGPGGGVAIVRDLTLLQETTAERERFERQMAQSEKMLAIGRVVSGVAHELNNPLAVVLGESEHLTDLPVDVEARESIRLINEQAHRARHIVRDLLAFVRPGDDRAEPLDLGALVEHVVAVQAPRAVAHGATIDVHNTTPKDFLVRVDRVGMEQVITNLLENAIDAGGAGATVTVRVVDRGATCLVTVEDTGPGVDPAHLDRIFEPFFTTKGVGHGTGLGLPVSLGLVERHGGTLRLENRPGPPIGARFIVTLPRCEDQLPAVVEAPPARTECAPPRHPGSGQPMPVLVVDDEPAVRSTIARIFSRWGWPVVEVASGEAALQHLAERDAAEWPAVIMCDLRMPGMSGQGVHAALVADFPALVDRVVFVTGDVVEPMTAAFLRAAGRPVVEKPFTMTELASAVAKVLEAS